MNEQIRAQIEAKPFRKFSIEVTDGRSIDVPYPDHVIVGKFCGHHRRPRGHCPHLGLPQHQWLDRSDWVNPTGGNLDDQIPENTNESI
jgi:hypothetical protein